MTELFHPTFTEVLLTARDTQLYYVEPFLTIVHRGGSRTAATYKAELFAIIVNGFQPLTIITKSSTLDVAAVLDPPLVHISGIKNTNNC